MHRTFALAVPIFSLFLCVSVSFAAPAPITFTHSWENALQSQFIDFGYTTLTDAQTQFVASHYAIVSLEKCFMPTPGSRFLTEISIYRQAARLKALNPSIKVLFYIHTDIVSLECYEAYHTYMAHSEWWLRDADGAFLNSTAGLPLMDTSVPAARTWWASIPLNGTTGSQLLDGGPSTLASLIDGVLADGTGARCKTNKVNASKCAALVEGKGLMIRELQGYLGGANGGAVFGNGLDQSQPNYNLDSLKDMGAMMFEHFAAFEYLLPNGTLNVDKVAGSLDAIATAVSTGKPVVVATWPGLFKTPFKAGLPSWPNDSQPNTTAGWAAAMLSKHTFALAGFLICAEANVFMQYQGWYQSTAGAVACPEAPTSCIAPNASTWYPALYQPLGPPLGPSVRSGSVWTRNFEHARAVFDVGNPDASQVIFFSVTQTPSITPTPSLSPSLPPTPSPTATPSLSSTLPPAPSQLGGNQGGNVGGAAQSTTPTTLSPGASAGLAVALVLVAAAVGVGVYLRAKHLRKVTAGPRQGGKGEGEEGGHAEADIAAVNPVWGK